MRTPERRSILLVALLSLLFLVACAASAESPADTVTLSAPKPIAEPSSSPTFTQPLPPTSMQAETPTTAPEPTSTPDVIATVVAIGQPQIHSSLLSPDGRWRAEVIIYDCIFITSVDEYAYEELELVEVNTGTKRVVDDQLQNCGGLGAAGLAGLFWSLNSHYLYYTQAREGVPDGCGYWERPITRYNLPDQKIEQLGMGPLSPDKTKIAAWQWPEKELVIWAVDGGELAHVAAFVPNANIGQITWSPDSQTVVYLQSEHDCGPPGKTYVIRLDLSTYTQDLLLKSEKPSWGNVIWESLNHLKLFDEDGKEWRYNLITKKLEPTT